MLLSEILIKQVGTGRCLCGNNTFFLKEKKLVNGILIGLRCKKCTNLIRWVSPKSLKESVPVEPDNSQPQGTLFQ